MNGDREFVDRVRSAADIAKVVGEYVHLRKSGRRLAGLCPFHAEKTPSFYVDEQKQLFHCFGCGVGGDVFKFLMLHEKMDFREALEALAEKHGIEIPRVQRTAGPKGLKDRLYEAHAAAAAYYRAALAHEVQGRHGREYLAHRGLRRETLERLGVGFAPRGWDGLKGHLSAGGFTPSEMSASGLVVAKSDGVGSYDRFRERVIFPIVAANGKVVGFGGRTIVDPGESRNEPKYMNSPETPIYSKSDTLYGLYPARDALKKERFAVLVEGYLDFASLYEAGIENVVASLGTAFTEGHAKLLARYVDGVVVNYDADTAGRTAALRSLAPLVAKGLKVKVLRLPAGEDPDLFVRRIGRDDYLSRIDAAPEYMDYVIEEAVSSQDVKSARGKVTALNQILPHLTAIESPLERVRYVPVLADRLAVEDSLILAEVTKAVKEKRSSLSPPPPIYAAAHVSIAEAGLIRVLVEVPGALAQLASDIDRELLPLIRTGPIIAAILETAGETTMDYTGLAGRLDENQAALLRLVAMRSEPVGDTEFARDCLQTLAVDQLQAECRRIQRRIDATSDGQLHADLAARKYKLSQRIRELS